jgi:2-isopropylmalate synthase
MDATRTEHDYLCRVVEIAIKAGATTINIPDTVGYTAPRESAALIAMLLERVPGADEITFATHCHNDLGMATANALAAVEAGARQIECTINGLGERAGNTALEEVVMALKVRHDIMPYKTGIDTTKIMNISRRVATVSGFPVQFNKAIVGKNAFAHESGIHQDGMLKNAQTFEIMRPQDVGLRETHPRHGQAFGPRRAAFQAERAGLRLADTSSTTSSSASRTSPTAKKEVFDEDLIAPRAPERRGQDRLRLKRLRVDLRHRRPSDRRPRLEIRRQTEVGSPAATADGPVDATCNAVRALFRRSAAPDLPGRRRDRGDRRPGHRSASRLEEQGRIATGQSADTDTVVASAKAYINAINRLLVRREKSAPGSDTKTVSYRDAG